MLLLLLFGLLVTTPGRCLTTLVWPRPLGDLCRVLLFVVLQDKIKNRMRAIFVFVCLV